MTETAKLVLGLGVNMGQFKKGMQDAEKSLDGFASKVGAIGGRVSAAFSAISGPMLAISGAGLAIGGAFLAVAQKGDEAANSLAKLNALLKTNAGAAGLSAEQIHEFSRELAYNTMANTAEIERAAGKLITYNKVSGESFKETLRLSQDLAQIGFGSLEENANRLGKALQDPITGVGALAEVGVSFTAGQKATIKEMVETNRVAEAQGVILKALADQVGGAGSSQGGLASGFDQVSQRVGEFFEVLDSRMSASSTFGEILTRIAEKINVVNEFLRDKTPAEQATEAIANLRSEYLAAAQIVDSYNEKQKHSSPIAAAVAKSKADAARATQLEIMAQLQQQYQIKTSIDLAEQEEQALLDKNAAAAKAAQLAADNLAAAAVIREKGAEVISNMERELALLSKKTEVEKVLYELQSGNYKEYEAPQKARIEALAREIEMKERMSAMEGEFVGPEKPAGLETLDEQKANAIKFYDDLFNYAEQSAARREEMEAQHDQRIADFKALTMQQQISTVSGGLSKMTEAMSRHSKGFFRINKIAGIANAIVNTAQGVTEALKLPFPANLAAAASVAAAGYAQIQAIRSQELGGGATAPTTPAAGGAATGTTQTPAAETSTARRVISVQGLDSAMLFDSRSVRELIRQIQTELGDGVILTA